MSLTFQQMKHLFQEVKPLVEESVCLGIIVSGEMSFTLILKKKESIHHLFLSFKERLLRFHLVTKPSVNNVKIPFVDKLSKLLVGETLLDFSLLNDDRILAFTFKKGGKVYRVVCEFLPRRANCYLMDTLQRIEGALHPVDHLIYDLPVRPEQRYDGQAHVEGGVNLLDSYAVAKKYADIETEEVFLHRKREVEGDFKKLLQRAVKRVEHGKIKLHECLQWDRVHHEGMLIQANLYRIQKGAKEVCVEDWEQQGMERNIALDPLVPPHEQVEHFFKKSRKLKAGIPHAERLLKVAEDEVVKLVDQQGKLQQVKTLKELDAFMGSKNPVKNPAARVPPKIMPSKPYHVFKSSSGREIWVGKSAKDNDKLSFQCARGLDWWLHARDYPGSHVVIPSQKGEELDEATLTDAAELALRYSKAKGQSVGEVSLTHVNAIVSVKGCPGKVMLSKHKTVRIKLDEKRWNRLKSKG